MTDARFGTRNVSGIDFARRLERDLAEQTARANHHEERATEALRDLAAVTRERDALLERLDSIEYLDLALATQVIGEYRAEVERCAK